MRRTQIKCSWRGKYRLIIATCQGIIRKTSIEGMPTEFNIEQQIRAAIERGDFDNLEGRGKPLDLDAYFNTPEDTRMAFAMLKSNEFVPEEVEIMREINELKAKIKDCENETEKQSLSRSLNEKSLALTLLLESR